MRITVVRLLAALPVDGDIFSLNNSLMFPVPIVDFPVNASREYC